MPTEERIEMTRTVNAPAERVYKALTDGKLLTKWFPSRAESDPRVGGKVRFYFDSMEGEDHVREGTFLELVPGKRVVYSWFLPEIKKETRVEWTLTPKGDRTELRLVHSGFLANAPPHESYEGHHQGWSFFVGNLDVVLSGGKDQRADKMGLKIGA